MTSSPPATPAASTTTGSRPAGSQLASTTPRRGLLPAVSSSRVHDARCRRRPAVDLLRDRRRAGRPAAEPRRRASPTRRCTTSPKAWPAWSARSWSRRGRTGSPAVALRPTLHGDWASHVTVPIFLSGALAGRADRPAVAGADRCGPEVDAGLLQHGQRRPYRLDRTRRRSAVGWSSSTSTSPTRSRRHRRDRPRLVLDEFASFASGVSAQAPLPAIRFTERPNVAVARRTSPPRPLSSRSSSTTVRIGRTGRHPVDVLGGLLQLAARRHGRDALLRAAAR